MIWFNPLYSKNVRTNIGRVFLRLVDTHFSKSSALHKIFNRNTIKVSYSCMKNVKRMISTHNNTILSKVPTPSTQPTDKKPCNCRDKNACLLDGNCLTKSIVYRAEITAQDKKETKQYIGVTANAFKERFGNHQKSFNNASYANETELSKDVWSLKKSNRPYGIKLSILNHSSTYVPGGNQCNLCSNEKLYIMKAEKDSLLNKRSEIFSKCLHQRRFLVGEYTRTRPKTARPQNTKARTGKQTIPNS